MFIFIFQSVYREGHGEKFHPRAFKLSKRITYVHDTKQVNLTRIDSII